MGGFGKFWWEDSGGSAVEYGLLMALIAVTIIGGVSLFGFKCVKSLFDLAASKTFKG